jgi:hypothetical protein
MSWSGGRGWGVGAGGEWRAEAKANTDID